MDQFEQNYQDDPINDERTIEKEETEKKFRLTVEIPLFFLIFGSAMAGVPITNLILYRTCLHSLNKTKEGCIVFLTPGTTNHSQELEEEVQAYAVYVNTAKSVVNSILPVVVSMFISGWSDKHGRKPLIVWPVFGFFVNNVAVAVYSMLYSVGPWWLLVISLPMALTGGLMTFLTGALCYVSDISTIENRSIRIMYIQLSYVIAATIGSFVSPYFLTIIGNTTYLMVVVAAIGACAYIYAILFVEESLRTLEPGTISNILSCEHIIEVLCACFRRKPKYCRAITLLTILASFLSLFTASGISGVLYLYTRNKLRWSMKDFTSFNASSTAMNFGGVALAIGIIQRMYVISDLNFTIISFVSVVIEYIIKALATTTWHMYLGSAISAFGTVSGSMMRSFLTKTIESADIAKVFALQGTAEALAPLLAPLVYNTLYTYTINTCPGAFYFLSSGINVLCVAIIIYIQYLLWKISNRSAYQRLGEC